MEAKPNKFYRPENFPFEVHGFYEEFINVETTKVLGRRAVDVPTRPLGSPGRVIVELTEPVTLTTGWREVTVKATKENPVRVWSMFQAVCGRKKTGTHPAS